jgi:hypothetical protein
MTLELGIGNFLGLFLKLYHNVMPTKEVADTEAYARC